MVHFLNVTFKYFLLSIQTNCLVRQLTNTNAYQNVTTIQISKSLNLGFSFNQNSTTYIRTFTTTETWDWFYFSPYFFELLNPVTVFSTKPCGACFVQDAGTRAATCARYTQRSSCGPVLLLIAFMTI